MPGWALYWLRPLQALVASSAEACLGRGADYRTCRSCLPRWRQRDQPLAERVLRTLSGAH